MDRHGMQSVAFLIFLSFSVFYVLNSGSHGGPEDVSTTSLISSNPITTVADSSRSITSQQVSSTNIKSLTATISSDAQLRRRLLQSGNQYIGYGALTGDSVPCPPQSGRSYYTPNCQSASGPVNPYSRGCSVITRCARG